MKEEEVALVHLFSVSFGFFWPAALFYMFHNPNCAVARHQLAVWRKTPLTRPGPNGPQVWPTALLSLERLD